MAGIAAVALLVGGLGTAAATGTAGATPPRASQAGTDPYTPTPSAVLSELSSVPASVFNAVGVTSATIKVTALTILKGKVPYDAVLVGPAGRHRVPGFAYWGAEYCPYCAATRWGLIVALARFGTFTRLFEVSSSSTDVDPNTPTFTFFGSLYKSSLFLFNGIEVEGLDHQPHMATPKPILRLVQKYNPEGYFPFLDIENRAILTGSAYDPASLQGLTQASIAGDLTDPTNAVTKAIVAEANYLSAAVCASDHERPKAVCTSSGVEAADTALGLPT